MSPMTGINLLFGSVILETQDAPLNYLYLSLNLEELGVEAGEEEILIDSDEKAEKFEFLGSPSIRINGKDIQEEVIDT
ncbi:MAG: hypothetical protein FIB07_14515 [Candidatus Methanoperedens sp.]|nr:hypothetical protein [Candidatus Methanoperedens sp.]